MIVFTLAVFILKNNKCCETEIYQEQIKYLVLDFKVRERIWEFKFLFNFFFFKEVFNSLLFYICMYMDIFI